MTFERGSENLIDLTHVKGKINGSRILTVQRKTKNSKYSEDVLVFNIENCNDEFGIMEYHEDYNYLRNLFQKSKELNLDIYYDPNRKRIEENITLHIFDMMVNGKKITSIENIKKTEYFATLICSLIILALLIFTYFSVKKIIKQENSDSGNLNTSASEPRK